MSMKKKVETWIPLIQSDYGNVILEVSENNLERSKYLINDLESHASRESGDAMLNKAKKCIAYINSSLIPLWKDGNCSSGNQIEDTLKICREATWKDKETSLKDFIYVLVVP